MKKINRLSTVRLIALLIVLSIALSSLFSCTWFDYVAKSKEEISENIASSISSGGSGKEYVTEYFREWGMPSFDTFKSYSIEIYFDTYYNYGDGTLPSVLSHAKEAAELFLDHFYDNINRKDLNEVTDALITCYVAALDDPYAVYRPAEDTDQYFEDMTGKFGGIGVVVEYNYEENSILVSNVYQNSPAELAGVLEGDYIYAVEGKTIDEVGIDNALNLIRGEKGTSVDLTFKRGDELITLSIMRDTVEEINASYKYDEETGLGYIEIVSFKGNTFEQFKKSVDALEALGAKGIVFDLRNNPGGYLYSVVDVISYLIPTGHKIVSFRYKNSPTEELFSEDDDGKDHRLDIPFVVLCNEHTASAGEIFTAALRDYTVEGILKGKTVGVNTYGKGIMQNTFSYPLDGSSVTMTVAYYDPPCGVNYHGVGVVPDVVVELGDEGDNQLEIAYETLKSLINNN